METIGSLLRHVTPSGTTPLRNLNETSGQESSEKVEKWKNPDFSTNKSGNGGNDPLRKYPTYKTFATAYNVGLQTWAVCNPERCFGGLSPTLADICRKYTKMDAETWVCMHLNKYAEDAFNSVKMKNTSLNTCAKYICAQFYWLKCSELILFFGYCVLGKYDDYVGSKLDIPAVMKALRQFIQKDRANYLATR